MRNILLLLGALGLIVFKAQAFESEENVYEVAAADSDMTDLELDEDLLDDEDDDGVALAQDEEELRPKPCKDLKCRAYRCKKNCKGGKKCQCTCKKNYGHKVPQRFTDLKCPDDPKPASGGSTNSGGSSSSGGSSGSGGSSKKCTTYICARNKCKQNCKGTRKQKSRCRNACHRKYKSNIDLCNNNECRRKECRKLCGHPRCLYSCNKQYPKKK